MICLSPSIDKSLEFNAPLDLEISFLMDNMKIVPNDNTLTVVHDPNYYPFENSFQQINSLNVVQFEVCERKFI